MIIYLENSGYWIDEDETAEVVLPLPFLRVALLLDAHVVWKEVLTEEQQAIWGEAIAEVIGAINVSAG